MRASYVLAGLLAALVVACAPNGKDQVPQKEKVAVAAPKPQDPHAYLRSKIAQAAARQVKPVFLMDLSGAETKVALVKVAEEEVMLEADGMDVGISWQSITPKRFFSLAAACIDDKSVADHFELARYAIEKGLYSEGQKELETVLALDPRMADAVNPLLSEARRKAALARPAAQAPAPPTPAPAPSPKHAERVFAELVRGWAPIGLSGGGAMFCPAISGVDPNLMMINCDMSAAYISTDGGHFWKMIHHQQLTTNTRCRPVFHPKEAGTVFAAVGSKIRVSRDKGETWRELGDFGGSSRGEIAIDADNPSLMLIGTDKGGAISYDGGKTWAPLNGVTGEAKSFHVDRTSPVERRTIFAATTEGIWRSDDNGAMWADKTKGLPWKPVNSFAGGSDKATGLIVLYCSIPSKTVDGQLQGGVYRSRDRGETWESAMGNGINKDTTAADRWAEGPMPQYKFVLATDVKPLTVYAVNTSSGFHPPHHHTFYRSDDGGDNWRAVLFWDPRFADYNVAPNYMTASCRQSYEGSPHWVGICPTDPDRVVRVTGECNITYDGGKTWFNGHCRLAPGQEPKPGCFWINTGLVVTTTWHYYIDPHEPNRHYIAYTDIGFARSEDGGKTWAWWEKNKWAPWRNTCYELAFDPDIPGKIWGAFSNVHDIPNDNIIQGRHWANNPERGPGGVCLSTDFGVSWKPTMEGMPEAAITSIVLDPKSPKDNRTLYATVFGKGVYKSTDDGKTWVNKSNGLGHPSNMRLYRVILHADGTLFAIICGRLDNGVFSRDGVGLYRSKDGGENWECITKNTDILYTKDFSVHPQNSSVIFVGAAATRNPATPGGLYRTTDGGATWKQVASKGRQHFGAYFHPKKPDWVYLTMTEGSVPCSLYLSTDGGDTWQPFDSFPFSNTQRVEFDPADDSIIYVTTFGGSVFKGPATPAQ